MLIYESHLTEAASPAIGSRAFPNAEDPSGLNPPQRATQPVGPPKPLQAGPRPSRIEVRPRPDRRAAPQEGRPRTRWPWPDPFILLSTDDLDGDVESAVAARFDTTSRAFNAAKRFVVVNHLHDAFLERFTARLLASETGEPLSSAATAEDLSVRSMRLAHREANPCTVPASGTVLPSPPGSSPVFHHRPHRARQELLGPVAMVFPTADEEDAVRIANDTPYGLGSHAFTTEPTQAERVANRIEAGMLFVNGVGAEGAELPFDGVKRSGFGRELGRHGIEEFASKKLIGLLLEGPPHPDQLTNRQRDEPVPSSSTQAGRESSRTWA
ncbi:aldehyde dehydrogenase family protein [Streptomyces sp. NPDC005953]|uniref:aldehyde dehydrogenase family protein n=1 Tax=Streptomyces sp. NPDC005953 TaxID=3156719 RepID=UPI0033FB4F8F